MRGAGIAGAASSTTPSGPSSRRPEQHVEIERSSDCTPATPPPLVIFWSGSPPAGGAALPPPIPLARPFVSFASLQRSSPIGALAKGTAEEIDANPVS
jgi:hypothetical protein